MPDPVWAFILEWERLRKAPDPSRSRCYWHLSPLLDEIGPERLRIAAERFYQEQQGIEPQYVPRLLTWLRERLWEPLLSEHWQPPAPQKESNHVVNSFQEPDPSVKTMSFQEFQEEQRKRGTA